MPEIDAQTQKLILLYMLKQVPGIPSGEWMNWAIESLYLDYFSFAQAKEELKKEKLISEFQKKDEERLDTSGNPVRRILLTPEGELVLEQLLPGLSQPVRAFLHEDGLRRKKSDTRENNILADYYIDDNGQYFVKLLLSDGEKEIIRMIVSVMDEAQAKSICMKWKKEPIDTYKKILYSLDS